MLTSNHYNINLLSICYKSATARIAAVLLPVLLYLSVVVMHDPLWAWRGTHHAKLQYQTTGADCCHELLHIGHNSLAPRLPLTALTR